MLYRNFFRNKFYSSLNIIGLSIGLICTILIVLYIKDELSYDKYNLKRERIVRLGSDFTINGKRDLIAASPLPYGPKFLEEFPEVEDFVRIDMLGKARFKFNDIEFKEDWVAYVDSSVFNIFTLPLLKGNPQTALVEPNTIVINEELALKYFGKDDPIGKQVTVDDIDFTISGVMKNQPQNSHYRFRALLSMRTHEKKIGQEKFNSSTPGVFWSFNIQTLILLRENASLGGIYEKFPAFYEKYMRSSGEKLNVDYKLILQKLPDLHLYSNLKWDLPTGDVKYIYILAIIAAFILSIASINYMNMSTARSAKRAKEVGVRKVVGAYKENIVRQFLLESIALTVAAYFVALIVVELLLPSFNHLVKKELVLNLKDSFDTIVYTFGISILLGVISGLYPAFYLSAFHPAVILKGIAGKKSTNAFLRKLLVILQFVVSSIMISGTIIVASQLFYMNNRDVGFNKENIIATYVEDTTLRSQIDVFKAELEKNPNIVKVASSSSLIGFSASKSIHLYESEIGMEQYALNVMYVDFDYLALMKVKIMQGRGFDQSFSSDTSSAFVINLAAARKFNWNEDAVGKKIQKGVEVEKEDNSYIQKGEVIGVVQNFNYESLKNKIEPLSIMVRKSKNIGRVLYIKIRGGDKNRTIDYIKNTWNQFSPNYSFDYFFLDQKLEKMYQSEKRLSLIFILFSVISVLVASLGLFGLSSFMSEQRKKEIGVRKVLGASVVGLVQLLTQEFIRLIFIANIIAIPVSYFAMSKWLQEFSYKVDIAIWMYLLTLLVTMFIGIITVAWQALKTAMGDPVNAIKYE
jgi:putative ABC transport system permease protein